MGNASPEQESAHDHELVTDDELLVEGPSLQIAADDAAMELPAAHLHERAAPRRAAVRVGEVLADKYRVERLHAPGALGVTCDATHLQLGQRVVVKLCASAARQSEDSARFLASARVAAQLRNQHLARVLDVGTLDSGIAYCVTEYFSGTDLRGVLRVREWLPVSEAVDYALQICEGLAVAHVAGFVHRNLKPANVFLAREDDGRPIVKVLDFCLAGDTAADIPSSSSTTESIVSSLSYLAPEQVRDPSSVDVRADIWALGALLHEMLTGSPLHDASSVPGIFAAIAADDATPIRQLCSELPHELEEVVLRCLEKVPDYRWADVGTLAKQLRRFASEEGQASVDRVVMVLERRTRSSRSAPAPAPAPALVRVEPRPAEQPVSQGAASPRRHLLELALAALAIMGCSVGVGAFLAINSLKTVLAARASVERPMVASLSPALAAAPPALVPPAMSVLAPAVSATTAVSPQPSARSLAVLPPKAWNRPAVNPQIDRTDLPVTAVEPLTITATEPARSTQALFDNAN